MLPYSYQLHSCQLTVKTFYLFQNNCKLIQISSQKSAVPMPIGKHLVTHVSSVAHQAVSFLTAAVSAVSAKTMNIITILKQSLVRKLHVITWIVLDVKMSFTLQDVSQDQETDVDVLGKWRWIVVVGACVKMDFADKMALVFQEIVNIHFTVK